MTNSEQNNTHKNEPTEKELSLNTFINNKQFPQ